MYIVFKKNLIDYSLVSGRYDWDFIGLVGIFFKINFCNLYDYFRCLV